MRWLYILTAWAWRYAQNAPAPHSQPNRQPVEKWCSRSEKNMVHQAVAVDPKVTVGAETMRREILRDLNLAPILECDASASCSKIRRGNVTFSTRFHIDKEGNMGGDRTVRARKVRATRVSSSVTQGKVLMDARRGGVAGDGPGHLQATERCAIAPNGGQLRLRRHTPQTATPAW